MADPVAPAFDAMPTGARIRRDPNTKQFGSNRRRARVPPVVSLGMLLIFIAKSIKPKKSQLQSMEPSRLPIAHPTRETEDVPTGVYGDSNLQSTGE